MHIKHQKTHQLTKRKKLEATADSSFYDETYFVKRDVLDIPVAEAIKKFMHEHTLNKVLDVGCGTGKLVKFLGNSGFDAYGCDINQIAIKMAQKINGSKKIYKASATKLPFADHEFDLVISISMIEHISKNQVSDFLNETKRLLKPGGYIYLVTPNLATPLRTLQGKNWGGYSDPTHINFYTPRTLAMTLRRNNFSQVKLNTGIPYVKGVGRKYLSHIDYIPDFLKDEVCFIFFSSPLRIMRNSFWASAQYLPRPLPCLMCKGLTRVIIQVSSSDKQTFFYKECSKCKLVTIVPFPKKIPRSFYAFSNAFAHGVQENPQLQEFSRLSIGITFVKLYTRWCNVLRFKLVSKIVSTGKLLDIGCSEGIFLKLFNWRKWDLTGVEINRNLAKQAREASNAKIYTQPVEFINLPKDSYDVVTLWHVFEHLTDPHLVLKKITQAIKPQGYIIIEVPNGQAMYRKIFCEYWQLLIPPQHLFLWSEKSLLKLLREYHYRIVQVSYFGIISFSGASSLANWLRARKVPSKICVYIAFIVFPFILVINFFQGKERENLLVVAQKDPN